LLRDDDDREEEREDRLLFFDDEDALEDDSLIPNFIRFNNTIDTPHKSTHIPS
jgi:hypothetical protein